MFSNEAIKKLSEISDKKILEEFKGNVEICYYEDPSGLRNVIDNPALIGSAIVRDIMFNFGSDPMVYPLADAICYLVASIESLKKKGVQE